MGWLVNTLVGLSVSVGFGMPNRLSTVPLPPPEPTIEEKILAELPPVFIKIAKAESRLKPNAYNPEWHYDSDGKKLCQGSFGLLQLSCEHLLENPEALYDVDMNIQLAKKIYEENGFEAWGVCTDGKVKCYE